MNEKLKAAIAAWNDEVKDYALDAREYGADSMDELNFKGSEIKKIILLGNKMRDSLSVEREPVQTDAIEKIIRFAETCAKTSDWITRGDCVRAKHQLDFLKARIG